MSQWYMSVPSISHCTLHKLDTQPAEGNDFFFWKIRSRKSLVLWTIPSRYFWHNNSQFIKYKLTVNNRQVCKNHRHLQVFLLNRFVNWTTVCIWKIKLDKLNVVKRASWWVFWQDQCMCIRGVSKNLQTFETKTAKQPLRWLQSYLPSKQVEISGIKRVTKKKRITGKITPTTTYTYAFYEYFPWEA